MACLHRSMLVKGSVSGTAAAKIKVQVDLLARTGWGFVSLRLWPDWSHFFRLRYAPSWARYPFLNTRTWLVQFDPQANNNTLSWSLFAVEQVYFNFTMRSVMADLSLDIDIVLYILQFAAHFCPALSMLMQKQSGCYGVLEQPGWADWCLGRRWRRRFRGLLSLGQSLWISTHCFLPFLKCAKNEKGATIW